MAKRNKEKKQGYSAGIIIGRTLSLPFIAAKQIGKISIKVAGKVLSSAVGYAADAQMQYNSVGEKSVEDIVDLATGKKYGTPIEKAAAQKYILDAKKRVDGE